MAEARPYMLERMVSSKGEARGRRVWVVALEREVRKMKLERRDCRRGEKGRKETSDSRVAELL